MEAPKPPQGYNLAQIVLHWVIAALVVFQLLFGDEIKPAYRAFHRGETPADAALFNAHIHTYVGLAVLVLALLRFAIRLTRGVPAPPAGESLWQRWLAAIAHILLYLFIFGMPATGMLAWYAGVSAAGDLHEFAKPVFIVVVGLHAAGALWQHFIAKTSVLVRMLRPGDPA